MTYQPHQSEPLALKPVATRTQQELEALADEQGITVEQLLCKHEWNQSAGEADESGSAIYCLNCGLCGDI